MTATTPSTPRHRSPRRKPAAEWLPRQHGAWAMLFLPYLAGLILRVQQGEVPAYLWPLLPTWIIGYFAFNALGLWLKSRRKPVYLRPLLTYAALMAVFGGLTLLLEPALLSWALAFAPLLGVGLWRAARGDDASLLARGSAVIAACLMCAASAVGSLPQWLALPLGARPTVATLALWGYFLGTLLYVKTMIRERGEARYLRLSLGFHALAFLLTLAAALAGQISSALPAFFALTTLRAGLMPQLERWRARRTTPKQVGLTEFALSFLLLVLLASA